MKLFKNSSILILLTTSLLITLISGCGTSHDHGPTPVGMVLSVDGTDIAMQMETTVSYTNGDHIEVVLGSTLGPILVEFIFEGGERYLPDTNEGFELQFNSTNSNVLSIGRVTGSNEWTIQLIGNSVGSSDVTFELWHVDHSDFISRPFKVEVVEPQLQD